MLAFGTQGLKNCPVVGAPTKPRGTQRQDCTAEPWGPWLRSRRQLWKRHLLNRTGTGSLGSHPGKHTSRCHQGRRCTGNKDRAPGRQDNTPPIPCPWPGVPDACFLTCFFDSDSVLLEMTLWEPLWKVEPWVLGTKLRQWHIGIPSQDSELYRKSFEGGRPVTAGTSTQCLRVRLINLQPSEWRPAFLCRFSRAQLCDSKWQFVPSVCAFCPLALQQFQG